MYRHATRVERDDCYLLAALSKGIEEHSPSVGQHVRREMRDVRLTCSARQPLWFAAHVGHTPEPRAGREDHCAVWSPAQPAQPTAVDVRNRSRGSSTD